MPIVLRSTSSLDRVEAWLRNTPPASSGPTDCLRERHCHADMSRNSNPKRQRVDVDNVLPTQSASQVGSISVVDLSNRTTLTAPQGSKRSSGPTRHLTDLRTAAPSITLSTFNQVIHFISFITVKMAKRSVEVILKYRFSNRKLLNKALLPAGAPVSNKHIQGEAEGNKRLAFLENSVLQEAILGP